MCAFASHHADARVIPDASAALAPAPTSFEKRLNELHELLACEKNFLLNQGYWEPGGGRVPELLSVWTSCLSHQGWWWPCSFSTNDACGVWERGKGVSLVP